MALVFVSVIYRIFFKATLIILVSLCFCASVQSTNAFWLWALSGNNSGVRLAPGPLILILNEEHHLAIFFLRIRVAGSSFRTGARLYSMTDYVGLGDCDRSDG
ncbi:hypothetical protein PHYBLDRAFT_60915 [Phycomyces blakesleeanus NRRL 1555(-)]|uniref:Uncharacterized protein n=1 Tax=Phycomyces blakesleeanus (strain ATCC 8743b / DSM 1359 / FGSC 10004 / NBRC 33097 / NRRL 1555) TaxID=763407 RepID=A0A162UTA3_PHYB8|nr:hypothetical protein PHYBLDRAFT_60915 [Phycomyces blakesleeanus NRRL 1555(-)]OAD77793.1 hypothetical protein PHYBLDRAFT_60915 [Phycomyces blakesleeanus NRRL 1555(-)]|eukprot:XP_018295833.1 hypothetical protein PHYBLDRAFT_60915 [Phycomyces blakesleeanus NRRL 1555(-)]